jgi:hypothetical protein
MLASRARHVGHDLVHRAIALPLGAYATNPVLLGSVASPPSDRQWVDPRGGASSGSAPWVRDSDRSWGGGPSGGVSVVRSAAAMDHLSAPRDRNVKRNNPPGPWTHTVRPKNTTLTVSELRASLRFADFAMARRELEYGGGDGFGGEDEDEWQDAIENAIRAIEIEDGGGVGGVGLTRASAERTDVGWHDCAKTTWVSPFVSFPPLGDNLQETFQASSVKLKRVKKMNKHKHRKRRKRDRNKTK